MKHTFLKHNFFIVTKLKADIKTDHTHTHTHTHTHNSILTETLRNSPEPASDPIRFSLMDFPEKMTFHLLTEMV